MNSISFIGALLITLSLLFYGIGSITLQRFKMISKSVFWSLLIGVLLDIVAVVCMIIGSSNPPFTVHAFLGYSAFTAMLIYFGWVYIEYRKLGKNVIVKKPLEIYAKFAYGWWVIVYLAGSLLVML
jgi:hypothetical protein